MWNGRAAAFLRFRRSQKIRCWKGRTAGHGPGPGRQQQLQVGLGVGAVAPGTAVGDAGDDVRKDGDDDEVDEVLEELAGLSGDGAQLQRQSSARGSVPVEVRRTAEPCFSQELAGQAATAER